jgi:hypothetical protein
LSAEQLVGCFGLRLSALSEPEAEIVSGIHRPVLSFQKYDDQPATFGTPGEIRNLSRILEKQNRLQMSQVLPFSCIDDQMGVAFQGFYERDRGTGKVTGFPHQL